MTEMLQYEFMRNALAAAVLSSLACGVIGSYVVVKRLVSISGGIAHAAFGGIGIGYFLGIDPIFGVLPFSLASAVGIWSVSRKGGLSEDTAVGIFWAMGMAVGVLFIGLTPGYAPDLFGYLFGNILTVPRSDLWLMLGLDALILGVVGLRYKELLALSFDEEFARVSGVRVEAMYLLLLCLVAVTVVVLIRIVGIVLVIALLTIPAAIARQHTRCLVRMMALSTLLGAALTLGGLWLSYSLNLPSGATIILLSGAAFAVSTAVRTYADRRSRRHSR
jgi:zinc transport system permease protein